MRIAQVAPLQESVLPRAYGGIERAVSCLTEQLLRLGHEVTLFASGDSSTRARLVALCPAALRRLETCSDPEAYRLVMLEEVVRQSPAFDLVHFHVDYFAYPFARRLACPHVHTMHWRMDMPDLRVLYREYREMPLVSVSDEQRTPLPDLNWRGTVHHGLPPDRFAFRAAPGRYLAILGRVAPEKRVDRAIAIARSAGVPLKVAAKMDPGDRDYIREVEPLLHAPLVEYVGELGARDKDELLGNALALVFPIDWPEPFGLVMIEALACGTPVIAWPNGAVPEVIGDGVTGFLVGSEDEAAEAVRRVGSLDRRRRREEFERRFTAARMARDYAALYRDLLREARGAAHSAESALSRPAQWAS